MRTTLLLSIIASMLMLTSCEAEDNSDNFYPTPGDSQQFLTLHLNANNKLEEGAYLSILKIKGKEASYQKLNNLYPPNDLRRSVEIKNNCVAIGLHTDFNAGSNLSQTSGAWFDIIDGTHQTLPLPPEETGHYAFCAEGSVKVSNSGHIFYLATNCDSDFGLMLVRYNPNTGNLDTAPDPTPFAVNQSGQGRDAETGRYRKEFYPSTDGRFVYGAIETFDADGGASKWNCKTLFKYDFDTQEYTQLGKANDNQVLILGMTSDGSDLLYNSSSGRKLVNVNTNSFSEINMIASETGGATNTSTSSWNSTGYCSIESNNSIGFYNVHSNEITSIRTPDRPSLVQFCADGTKLYFMLNSAGGKYLCRTKNLSQNAPIDTLCKLSPEVTEFMVIK